MKAATSIRIGSVVPVKSRVGGQKASAAADVAGRIETGSGAELAYADVDIASSMTLEAINGLFD